MDLDVLLSYISKLGLPWIISLFKDVPCHPSGKKNLKFYISLGEKRPQTSEAPTSTALIH